MQFLTFSLLCLPAVLAQYGGGDDSTSTSPTKAAATTTAATASTTSSAASATHTVSVGKSGLAFTPNNLTAAAGETVEFHFFAPVHSVAQAAFAAPCAPLSATSFFSGGVSSSSGEATNVFTVTVNDTTPIWFYCGFPSHCQSGMTGVINPA